MNLRYVVQVCRYSPHFLEIGFLLGVSLAQLKSVSRNAFPNFTYIIPFTGNNILSVWEKKSFQEVPRGTGGYRECLFLGSQFYLGCATRI